MSGTVGYIQGVQTPDTVVDPIAFAQLTRRDRFAMLSNQAIVPASSTQVQLKKAGVVAGLEIRVSGSVVIGGTIGTTTMSYEWPHNLLKQVNLSVNGQSNLISARGVDLKVNEFMAHADLTDRGVAQRVGNATAIQQGTLSLSCEDWGGTGAAANFLAPGLNVAAVGTYPIELNYFVPIAADQVNLVGSVFGQSQATSINAELVWGSQSELFSAVGGAATVTLTGINVDVTGVVYSIPIVGGKTVLPDLSQLHGISTVPTSVSASGDLEYPLAGIGAGRKLLRTWFQVYSSAAPLAVNDTNYGNLGYKFGTNTVPETLPSGAKLRALNERQFNSDIGKAWGFGAWDYVSQYALRDVIDLGAATDYRLIIGLKSTPTTGKAYVSQETLFAAAVGA